MKSLPFIPYFQTTRYRVEAMVELVNPKPGEIGVDLGSGDGRIVIAFAKKGVSMVGFELDEKLVKFSQTSIQNEELPNATIEQKDFWGENLAHFDIVAIYPMPDILETLEKKILKELRPSTRLVVNYYPLPTLIPEKIKDHIYLYRR